MARIDKNEETFYQVIHPLYDEPDEKVNVEALGPMKMTRSVKVSLMILRLYLIAMMVLAFYRVISVGWWGA